MVRDDSGKRFGVIRSGSEWFGLCCFTVLSEPFLFIILVICSLSLHQSKDRNLARCRFLFTGDKQVIMFGIFKVVRQSEVSEFNSQKSESGKVEVSTLELQEFGGKYADSFLCDLKGKDALCKFYAGELVAAKLRFRLNEYNGKQYQNVTVEDIRKI